MKTRVSLKYPVTDCRCRHGHKYSKYMKRPSRMMPVCIKQQLSNI